MKNYDNEEQIFYAANAVSGSGFYKFENNWKWMDNWRPEDL